MHVGLRTKKRYAVGKLYRFTLDVEMPLPNYVLQVHPFQRALIDLCANSQVIGVDVLSDYQLQQKGMVILHGDIAMVVQTIMVDFNMHGSGGRILPDPEIIEVPIMLFRDQVVIPSKNLCYHNEYIQRVYTQRVG